MTDFGLGYLAVGYGLAFAAIAGYVVALARRQKRLQDKLDDLTGEPTRDS